MVAAMAMAVMVADGNGGYGRQPSARTTPTPPSFRPTSSTSRGGPQDVRALGTPRDRSASTERPPSRNGPSPVPRRDRYSTVGGGDQKAILRRGTETQERDETRSSSVSGREEREKERERERPGSRPISRNEDRGRTPTTFQQRSRGASFDGEGGQWTPKESGKRTPGTGGLGTLQPLTKSRSQQHEPPSPIRAQSPYSRKRNDSDVGYKSTGMTPEDRSGTPTTPRSPPPRRESEKDSDAGAAYDDETTTKKIQGLITEYLTAVDLQEATLCITELKNPKQHFEVVSESLKVCLETTKDTDKPRIVTLLCELKANDTLSTEDFNKGLATVLADAEDTSIDIPTFGKILGNTCGLILAKREDALTPEGIKSGLKVVEESIAKSQADEFKAEMLKILSEALGADHDLVQSFK